MAGFNIVITNIGDPEFNPETEVFSSKSLDNDLARLIVRTLAELFMVVAESTVRSLNGNTLIESDRQKSCHRVIYR